MCCDIDVENSNSLSPPELYCFRLRKFVSFFFEYIYIYILRVTIQKSSDLQLAEVKKIDNSYNIYFFRNNEK